MAVGLRHALVRGCWGREEEQDEEREVQVSSWLKELREVMDGFSQEASELLDQVRHNAIRSTYASFAYCSVSSHINLHD